MAKSVICCLNDHLVGFIYLSNTPIRKVVEPIVQLFKGIELIIPLVKNVELIILLVKAVEHNLPSLESSEKQSEKNFVGEKSPFRYLPAKRLARTRL